jgi:hypothetical protein
MPWWGLIIVVLKMQGNIIMNLHVLFLFNKLYLYVCFCYITVSHSLLKWSSWLWSHSDWIYSYLCNQSLLPVPVRIPFKAMRCRYHIMWSNLSVTCNRSVVFPVTPISSINKIDRQDISDILLKASLNTISLILLLSNYFRTKRYDQGFILVHSCLMNINNFIHS